MDRANGLQVVSGRVAGRAARSSTSWCARGGRFGPWGGARAWASRPVWSRCEPTCTTPPTPPGPWPAHRSCTTPRSRRTRSAVGNFERMNDAIAGAASAAGARLVFADNLYMYGPGGSPMTETTPQSATNRKGIHRIRLAADLLARHERGDLEVAIGRSSDYFGPHGENTGPGSGCSGLRSRARRRARSGASTPHSLSYLPDLALGRWSSWRPRRGGRARSAPAGH